MIPSDLAARLRMLTEASFFDSEPAVQGTARVREIQARLPELLPGERFTARLQESLPDGTFKAIVAGRSYTLALNHAAKAGDTLELVVTQNTPKAVFAQLATPPPGQASATAAGDANLSATGRLISFLLTGQPPAKPAALAGGQPLLPTPPAANGAPLAPLLRQALAQSGLFYESHQNQWLAGKVDTAMLKGEPQGSLPPGSSSSSGTPSAPGTPAQGTQPNATPAQAAAPRAGLSPAAMVATGAPSEAGDDDAARVQQTTQAAATARAPIPERVMPIVHQQLDALATQNYVWHGQVWPGQNVEWEIEDPGRERQDEGEEGPDWNTTLRLTLPRLGGVEARLHLTAAGVALKLIADEPAAVDALSAGKDRLDAALAAANVPLTGFAAEQRHAE